MFLKIANYEVHIAVERDIVARPYLSWIKDEYDTVLWIWPLQIVISNVRRFREENKHVKSALEVP